MSNYERNNTMVICIIGVLVAGAIAVGALAAFGNWGFYTGFGNRVDYYFDAEVGATTGTVALDVDLEGGTVAVEFEENSSLLYRVEFETSNQTINQHGEPSITFSSNTIVFAYPGGSANITLGSALNYTIDVRTTGGTNSLTLADGAHVGDVTLATTAGTIDFVMTDDVVLMGNPDFDFTAGAGTINIVANLPAGIGGSIEASTTFGSTDVTAPGWTEITPTHYESSDYDTASQRLTIVAVTNAGSITATVT
jgi:hypothetical protein